MANEKSDDPKQQPKSKYTLATERQWLVCKSGWNCWKRQGLKCCPGCTPKVEDVHYDRKCGCFV